MRLKHLRSVHKISLLSVAAAAAIAGAYFFSAENPAQPGQDHEIVLRENGYEPAVLEIREGDTVTFRSEMGEPYWPASNLHPTHEIYPEFDPREPVPGGEAWSFRFDKAGEWKYHDHLFPAYRGVIRVQEKARSAGAGECRDRADSPECWNERVTQALQSQGIEQAFDLALGIYENDPKAAQSCHALAHTIGEEAYRLFAKGEEFKVSPKAGFCNFGFYHGFMGTMVAAEGNVRRAGEFCDYIDKQLSENAQTSIYQCYHGIGHGTVGDHDPRLWGDERAMIKPALELCESVSRSDEHLYRCVSGVYNGIANFYIHREYELEPREADPLWICREQSKQKYKESCYGNMHPLITSLSQSDFGRAAEIIAGIEDPALAVVAMRYTAGDFARFNLDNRDFSKNVEDCRKTRANLLEPCLTGFVTGLMDTGRFNEEYVQAINFCRTGILSAAEKDTCFKHVLSYLPTMYSVSQMKQVCGSVEAEYLKYCNPSFRT